MTTIIGKLVDVKEGESIIGNPKFENVDQM
jgi:hypothetical protein